MKIFQSALLSCASAILFSTAASAQCKDPWVSQAIIDVTGHTARTSNSYDLDCNINNYNGGHWTSYPDLVAKVAARYPASTQCHDHWVSQAVFDVTGHFARTTTSYDGDCNINNYTGHWSSYSDLTAKIRAYFAPRPATPAQAAVSPTYAPPQVVGQRPVAVASPALSAAPPALAARPANVVGANGAAAAGIVSTNGSNIVASGAGNLRPGNPIVSSGAGNIVASGAGNFTHRGSDDLKLAEQGDPQAMYRVGMAMSSEGASQNLPEAYKWLSLAADHGVAEAADERKALRAKLTADQVKQINLEVKSWKPQAADKK